MSAGMVLLHAPPQPAVQNCHSAYFTSYLPFVLDEEAAGACISLSMCPTTVVQMYRYGI